VVFTNNREFPVDRIFLLSKNSFTLARNVFKKTLREELKVISKTGLGGLEDVG